MIMTMTKIVAMTVSMNMAVKMRLRSARLGSRCKLFQDLLREEVRVVL